MAREAHLVLADGTRFRGTAIGAEGSAVGEAVFTTGMTGYQEVLTDPSYCSQIVTMTAPEIGNTGVNAQDEEATRPWLAGFVVHELSHVTSNWRANESLDNYLKRWGIVGIAGIDTRTLTRNLRDKGVQQAAVGTETPEALHDMAKRAATLEGQNLAARVSTKDVYTWNEGNAEWSLAGGNPKARELHIAAVDFGVKRGILRCLAERGCKLTVLPANATAADVLKVNPDGVFLSNGPGDPAAVTQGVATVRELLGKKPMFGICLGHQILSLALGGKTYKMKFGHRGLNQPVKDLTTGRIEVTTQNHGFCVDVDSLKGRCELTHMHLNDGTCEGIVHGDANAFSVQYHPEAHAGPHDARYLFDRFIDRIHGAR